MTSFQLPYIKMPSEFTTLLKSNLSMVSTPRPVFEVLLPNRGLCHVLDIAFKEFDDGKGIEKLVTALGWPNFRERMAGLYIYKSIFGKYPTRTSMDLVEDIKDFETKYRDHGVHGYSRAFLLGFYLRLSNIEMQARHDGTTPEIKVKDLRPFLKLSHGRSEKVDWLILLLMHLSDSLGDCALMEYINHGKNLGEIYEMMPESDRENMHQNLLAYAASINESDFFLYEKV